MTAPLIKLLPPWCVLALAVYWLFTYSTGTLAVLGLAATAELFLWAHRIARAESLKTGRAAGLERFLTGHPLAAGAVLVIFGVLIDLARMVAAVALFAWWLVGAPAWMINRQRFERAKALRLQATAQAVLAAAQNEREIAAGASLQERALAVLSKPLGLRAPEAPRVLERAPLLVEAAPVAAAQVEDGAPFRTVNGVTEMLVAKADGAVYLPLPSTKELDA